MNQDDINEIISSLAPKKKTLCQDAIDDFIKLLEPIKEGIFTKYRYDAIGYFKDVLKAKYLSPAQVKLLTLLSRPADDNWSRKVAVGTSVSYGKSWVGGGIINWYYDAWGPSCNVITTAPTHQSVIDLLWKEVRLQRGKADTKWGIGAQDFIGPQAPAMRRGPDWWARGYVAQKGESWKGRHVDNMCFVFDEAVGMDESYFRQTKTMFKSNSSHIWVCLFNPTDTTCPLYHEIMNDNSDWEIIEMSAFDHPNIQASLRGEPAPIPPAISRQQLEDGIKDECERVERKDIKTGDFEWPPNTGNWYRPSPVFEGDFMGRWPSTDESAIWSQSLWKSVTKPLTWDEVEVYPEDIPRIGVDVAYRGWAKTVLHVSWGDYSVYHESRSGQEPMTTVGRIIELCEEWAERCSKAREGTGLPALIGRHVPIKVDDCGIGGGVTSRLREMGYNVWPIHAQEVAIRKNKYRNRRSELWFMTRDRAKLGKLKLGLLPKKTLDSIMREAMAPKWALQSDGVREVERKEMTEKTLGHSPDQMDAMNLSYYCVESKSPEVLDIDPTGFVEKVKNKDGEDRARGITSWRSKNRRGIFGKR